MSTPPATGERRGDVLPGLVVQTVQEDQRLARGRPELGPVQPDLADHHERRTRLAPVDPLADVLKRGACR